MVFVQLEESTVDYQERYRLVGDSLAVLLGQVGRKRTGVEVVHYHVELVGYAKNQCVSQV